MADYVPRPDLDFSTWHGTFVSGASSLAAKYGIDPNLITQAKADDEMWGYIMDNSSAVANFGTSFNSFKQNLRSGALGGANVEFPTPFTFTSIPASVANGIERRSRILAGMFKANKTVYTEADGKLLGIIGDDPIQAASDMNDMQPVLILLLIAGKVQLKWKKGKADGINIYVDRGDGNFVFFSHDAQPDFLDNTPLPASATTWTYRAIYVVKDTEVGQFSEAVSINVKKIV